MQGKPDLMISGPVAAADSLIKRIFRELLDYSVEVFNTFSVPFISLDIAISDNKFYLIEFQFVHFGTYTAEKSSFYFQKTRGNWETVEERIVIETVFAKALHWFISSTL